MTSNLTGNGPPLPPGNRNFPLPPSRAASQALQQTPRSWPRQTFTQTNSPVVLRDTSEPAFKRQKLDDTENLVERVSSGNIASSAPNQTSSIRGGAFAVSKTDTSRNERDAQACQSPLLPLRPGRDPRLGGLQRGRPLAFERAARRDAVPVKPYVPEPPSIAPRLHKIGPADFFPWSGRHAEDVLNELTTKQGFYDKSQVSKDETNTAKHSIHQSLKHRSGVQVLSSLFVSTLDKRQVHGTITATSTFKPPPRVTLTDTKREAWLRDLANSSIPLRRLSRTIPHGIRGRILLDHCLSKDIPTSRAIWLAKCVGANEIRAFKRKGAGGVFTVGGEAKWIKDWTTNVEQFLESIISICGSSGWRAKIDYGLRLASHLYSDHLLDRGQYLDWVIGSVGNSDLDSLPLWLLVTQIHQQEILRHRQRGRLLTEAVLGHLYQVNLPIYKESYDPVLQQLVALLRSIMSSASACFLLPHCWSKHEANVRRCLPEDDDRLLSCFEGLSRRNHYLRDRSLQTNRVPAMSPREAVISLLDALSIERNFGKTAGACLRIMKNHHLLISTCIEWSASVYRQGRFRTYAAARLLRTWSKHGIELQPPILEFLGTHSAQVGVRKSDIYRLLAELVTSKHLSVGKYLQWLMARGTLHGHKWPDPDDVCEIRFLLEIPLHDLPAHVLNLRQSLLSPLAINSNHEVNILAATKAGLTEQIPGFFPHGIPLPSKTLDCDSAALSQALKSDVARWIRQTLIFRLRQRESLSRDLHDSDQHVTNADEDCAGVITLAQFQAIRKLLEEYGNFSILADLLNILSTAVRGSVLTAVCDTVNFHFNVFDAIGAAADLFQNLYDQREDLSGQEIVEKAFIESLIDLGRRLPEATQEIQNLRKELCLYAPKSQAAACSPISDNMIEAAQSTEPTFADDMDQMLAGGTSMDKQTLTRVFDMIMAHLEKILQQPEYSIARISQLLARLRGFDIKVFDLLLQDWLRGWLQLDCRPKLLAVLPSMLCSKVVSLKVVLEAVAQKIRGDDVQDPSFSLALEALEVLVEAYSESMPIVDFRAYRIADQLHRLIRTDPALLKAIFGTVTASCTADDSSVRLSAQTQVRSPLYRDLVNAVLLQRPENTGTNDSPLCFSSAPLEPWQGMASLIYPVDRDDGSDWDAKRRISNIISIISEFNMPLAQFELKTVLELAAERSEELEAAFSGILVDQVTASTNVKLDLLACLVSKLPIGQAASIREKAERELLARIVIDNTTEMDYVKLHSLTSLVEAATFSILDGKTTPFVEQVTLRLTCITVSAPLASKAIVNAGKEEGLFLVDLLLRLLIIHQTTMLSSTFPQDALMRLLISLSLLLNDLSISSNSLLQQQVLDVLTFLSDSLTDDTRARCICTLRDQYRTKDPRLRFVFGYDDIVEDEWLQLVSKSSSAPEGPTTTKAQPYTLRRWEMMQDATPLATENDTSLSLSLFGARKSVL